MWFKLIHQIKQDGSFFRNVSINSSWNIFGILAQFILSPIITRLYAPDQYGVFAIFSTIVINIVLISSFRYSEAITITDTKEHRNNTIALSFLLILSISAVTAIAVFCLERQVLVFIGAPWFSYFIYAIPLCVLLGGIFEILLNVNVWKKNFFSNGLAGFFVNICSRGFTILYGVFFQPTTTGLVGGDLVGKITGVIAALASFRNLKNKIYRFYQTVTVNGIKSAARLYGHFPLYSLPINVLAALSGHLPIYFFQVQFSAAVVGSYALSNSLLEIVNRLIPYSIAGVFLRKAMELKSRSLLDLARGTHKLYIAMFFLATCIFTTSALISKTVFPWVFGNSWQTAGLYTGILSIHYSFHFILSGLSEVYKVIGKQRFLLGASMVSLFLKIMMIIFASYFAISAMYALFWFCIVSAIGSIVQILGIFIHLRFKVLITGISLLLLMFVLVVITFMVNF